MTLLTWDWSDFGNPTRLEPTDSCFTIEHPYGGGYMASRPEADKMPKAFSIGWSAMTSEQWLNLVEFWRSVKGNANAFYFPFPVELYGSPGYGGYGGLEPADGFDADVVVGFGDAPVFTVRFVGRELPQRWESKLVDRWSVDAVVREVA